MLRRRGEGVARTVGDSTDRQAHASRSDMSRSLRPLRGNFHFGPKRCRCHRRSGSSDASLHGQNMQASDVLWSHSDHQAGAGMFGPYLHRDHFLMRPHRNRRHHFGGRTRRKAAYRMALLQTANGPG